MNERWNFVSIYIYINESGINEKFCCLNNKYIRFSNLSGNIT